MVSSFLPKNEWKNSIWGIIVLLVWIFRLFFGRIEDTIHCSRDFLTFNIKIGLNLVSVTIPMVTFSQLFWLFITLSLQEENSRNTIEFQKKLLNRRRKRQTSNNVNDSPENNQKAIEIAVFVDDDLYYKTKKANSGDPIEAIQNLVFAYLNSVIIFFALFLTRSIRSGCEVKLRFCEKATKFKKNISPCFEILSKVRISEL